MGAPESIILVANDSINASRKNVGAAGMTFFHLPDTSAVAWIMTAVFFLTLIFNGMLIIAYCKYRFLRTPFGVYTISLSCGDFLQTLILGPHNVITFLRIPWPLGKFICGVVFYSAWAVVGFSLNVHLLICMNRLWAVTFPNSYRLHHNRRVAALLVLALVVYVNLWTLPGFVVYAKRYYSEEVYSKRGCSLQSPPDMVVWLQCVVTAMYLVPNVLILVIYPVIYHRVRTAEVHRKRKGSMMPVSATHPASHGKHCLCGEMPYMLGTESSPVKHKRHA